MDGMNKYTIRSPVPDYTGTGWGLEWKSGQAHTCDARLAEKLRLRGYAVETDAPGEKPAARKRAKGG